MFSDAITKERNELPIAKVRNKIIDVIKKSETIIFIGETACGKTTQIPQFLYEENFFVKNMICESYQIGITQPRRVAAISIATRVGLEMKSQIGAVVGYSVRFDNTTTGETRIKYVTDGILLMEAISDPLLTKYKVIILDEAHERTIQTDILFGVVKKAQEIRKIKQMPILKIIIMSATMDVDHFSNYFNNAPVYYLPGRQHSIKMMYVAKKQSDYIHSALVTVFQIHQNEPEGDILVFCTGQEEIEHMVSTIKDLTPQLPSEYRNITPLPLYSALPSSVQMNVFKPLSKEFRKVIFATNIAETSITIPNIKYVVDTGMFKAKSFNPSTGFESLKITQISKAQACQRAGRAGRESSGICYRLYTKEEYNSFKNFNIPDIQCCNLSNVILHLIALGINDVFKFDFMSKPTEESIKYALHELSELEAIETKNELYYLTEQGKLMVMFPVDPRFSKIIVTASKQGCVDEAIIIISLLSVDQIFYIPSHEKERAAEVHKKFISSEGDLIKLLNIFKAFIAHENIAWCKENFIHIGNLKLAIRIREQLLEICTKANITKTSCGNDTEIVRRCLNSGLYLNSAMLQRNGTYKTKYTKQEVFIHPSSCLFGTKPECLVYTELIQTSKSYMRNLTVISEDWLNN